LPPGGRVLDVGCGAGKFLELLRVERPDAVVAGIEPNELLGRYARDRLGVPVHLDRYQSFTALERFDLVVAFHVMEHVHDLMGFLAFLRGQVSDAGHVAIESPNLDGSWDSFHMFHLAHLYAFTPASAAAIARQCGFETVSCAAVEAGWDRSNLHMLLRPSEDVAAAIPSGLDPTEATLAKLRRVALPRWYCVLRSWAKLVVRRLGLEPLARRLRGQR
jgi:SAM-dependent methyltransferase